MLFPDLLDYEQNLKILRDSFLNLLVLVRSLKKKPQFNEDKAKDQLAYIASLISEFLKLRREMVRLAKSNLPGSELKLIQNIVTMSAQVRGVRDFITYHRGIVIYEKIAEIREMEKKLNIFLPEWNSLISGISDHLQKLYWNVKPKGTLAFGTQSGVKIITILS
ncbi:hypothetical protein COY27_03410 [Candidatus Woesearchaeota archaeon CG_4_10_14_0_2_um_filter_33_13]|nr:MAG: hypothetical protein COY27_03410 [Candidatus Woesearchaeota archaeon CG_4_10_14_0_2_um_filter_33_13]